MRVAKKTLLVLFLTTGVLASLEAQSDTTGVQVELHNLIHVPKWTESQSTDIRYVDFSK